MEDHEKNPYAKFSKRRNLARKFIYPLWISIVLVFVELGPFTIAFAIILALTYLACLGWMIFQKNK